MLGAGASSYLLCSINNNNATRVRRPCARALARLAHASVCSLLCVCAALEPHSHKTLAASCHHRCTSVLVGAALGVCPHMQIVCVRLCMFDVFACVSVFLYVSRVLRCTRASETRCMFCALALCFARSRCNDWCWCCWCWCSFCVLRWTPFCHCNLHEFMMMRMMCGVVRCLLRARVVCSCVCSGVLQFKGKERVRLLLLLSTWQHATRTLHKYHPNKNKRFLDNNNNSNKNSSSAHVLAVLLHLLRRLSPPPLPPTRVPGFCV